MSTRLGSVVKPRSNGFRRLGYWGCFVVIWGVPYDSEEILNAYCTAILLREIRVFPTIQVLVSIKELSRLYKYELSIVSTSVNMQTERVQH